MVTAGTDYNDQARATEIKRVARRNSSLSSTGRLPVFAFSFVVSVGIAAAPPDAMTTDLIHR